MRNKIVRSSVCALVGIMFVLFFVSNAPAPPLPTTASISLIKSCTDASGPGQSILFSATLNNTGSDRIISITCGDVPITDLSGVPSILEPGQSATITGSYIPTTNPSTDTITCSGTGELSFENVSASGSATCSYPEGGGCTLTPGYWKTHSTYGPAPYDEVWEAIGEDTIFYLSGQSYYDVLWTTPGGGNAYYILAHQFIAAMLNIEKGASVPSDVQAAFDEAEDLFETWMPSQIGAFRGNNSTRAVFVRLAGVLDKYNNGILGPGHCK